MATTAWSLPLVRSLMSFAMSIMRVAGHALGQAGRAEIDQHVRASDARIVEAEQEAVAEPDIVRADLTLLRGDVAMIAAS